jgi:serine/threonine-protein kinase
MRRARDAADRALQIEPTMAEALTARACVRALYDWDWKAAEREFRHVTRIAPLYGTAHHWLAVHCLTPLGRFEEAQEQLRIACELDPLSPSVRASRGIVHYFAGRPSDAIPEYRTVLETHPDFALAHYFLGQALDALGHAREAVAEIQEAARLGARPPEVVAALGHALAASGDRAGAEAALAELEARASSAYVSPVLVAQVLVGLGERERALEALAHARSIRAADLIWLGVRPVFVPLRGEPDFDALLEAIGLTQARSAATAR